MSNNTSLQTELRQLLVDNLMLQVQPADIRNDQPLFGPDGLGLDSVDALQLVVALDKNYGLKIPDPAAAREILRNLDTIAAAITQTRTPPA